jgi:hypothetical protein
MRVLLTSIILLLIPGFISPVHADQISEIREYYTEVKERLEDGYSFYRTEITINTEDKVYPALGNYQENITFYWNSEGGYQWLVLVIWTGEYAARDEYGEILYENPDPFYERRTEEVVFQYVSSLDWDGNPTEYRWWYSDDELIQSSARATLPDDVVEFSPDSPEALDLVYTPQRMLDLFYMIHN